MVKERQYGAWKIILYILLWSIIGVVLHYISINLSGIMNEFQFLKLMFVIISVFYLNYFVFIPNLLSKRKIWDYVLSLVGILVLAFFFIYLTELPFYDSLPFPDFDNIENSGYLVIPPPNPVTLSLGIVLLSIVSLAVSTGIRGTHEWFKQENQIKEIENKKLIAELSYLKAQMNPHFFFNTLNGIYALARQKSDKTPEVIMMLSILMRYVIYDANAPRVPLKKEVAHIRNFIDLQKMRLSEIVRIDYKVTGNTKDILIEPLLFTALVENAFKHGIDYTKESTIRVLLEIQDKELHFFVSNPMVIKKRNIGAELDKGIGLDNIKKRLQLLYPGRHKLTIVEKDSIYSVELKIMLEKSNYEMFNN